jgi:hypothetical protein
MSTAGGGSSKKKNATAAFKNTNDPRDINRSEVPSGAPVENIPETTPTEKFVPSFKMRENPNKGQVKGAFEILNDTSAKDTELKSSYPAISEVPGAMRYLRFINGKDFRSQNTLKDLVRFLNSKPNNASITEEINKLQALVF